MTPRRTMAIAQQLYEGVDIEGEGTVGLITYMRTDSLRLSEEALAAARSFISGALRRRLLSRRRPAAIKTKAGAQDAHEAIRPTNVDLDPGAGAARSLTHGAVPALQADLEPLRGLPDGQRRLRHVVSIDIDARAHIFRANHSEHEILRLYRRL